MSIRNALLSILHAHELSTYALRQEFEARTNGIWPLNIGQVSSTMSRLERDGLVEREAGQDAAPWQLTDAGRADLARWWEQPVTRTALDRDELVIKLSMAASDGSVDVHDVVQRERSAIMRALHDITRALRNVEKDEVATVMILRSQVYALEAEIHWLDDVDGLVHMARRGAVSAKASKVSEVLS